MKIKNKLLLIYLIFFVGIVSIAFINLNSQKRMSQEISIYSKLLIPGILAINKIDAEMLKVRQYTLEYRETLNVEYFKKARESLHKVTKYLLAHKVYHYNHHQNDEFYKVEDVINSLVNHATEYLLLAQKGGSKEKLLVISQVFDKEFKEYEYLISPIMSNDIKEFQEIAENFERKRVKLFTLIIGILLVGLIVLSFLSFTIMKSITSPINNLLFNIKSISKGNISSQIDKKLIQSKDEIGVLALAFHNMINHLNKVTVSKDELQKEIKDRLKTEKILRESEQLNRAITENSPFGISVRDKNGTLILYNNSWKTIWNLSDEDIERYKIKKHKLAFNHKDSYLYEHQEKIRKIYEKGGHYFTGEIKLNFPEKNKAKWISQYFYAIEDKNDEVKKVVVLTEDISKHKQAEEKIFSNEKELRATLHSIGDAVIATDNFGKVIRMNPIAEKLTGWNIEDAKDRKLTEILKIFNAETGIIVENPVDKVLNSGEIVGIGNHTKLISKNGEEYQISDSAAPIINSNNEISGVVLVFRDVTDEYRMRAELVKKEKYFRALIENSTDVLSVIDAKGNYLFVSSSFEKVLGYKLEELNGKNSFEFVYPEDRKKIQLQLEIGIRNDSYIDEINFRALHKNGSIIYLEGTAKNMLNSPIVKGIILNYRDVTERENSIKILQKSENKYRLLAENISDVIWVYNFTKKKFTYISPSVLQFRGYTVEEAMAFSFIQSLTQESSEKLNQKISLRLENFIKGKNEIYRDELQQECKDGSFIWVEIITSLHYADDGTIEVLGSSRNINERKLAELELKKLFIAVEQSANTIIITDIDGNIEYTNPKFTKLTNYTFEEVNGKNPRILKSKNQSKEVFENLWKTISAGKEWHGEFHNRKKNGELFWESASISPVFDKQGKIINYLKVAEDITLRKETQEALKKNEEKLRLIIDNSPIGFSVTDLKGHYIDANNAYCKMLGYTKNEILNKHFNEHTHPDDRTKNLDKYKNLVSDRIDYFDLEKRYIHKNGEIIYVFLRSQLVRDNDGKPYFEIAIVEDITERKHAESELRDFKSIIDQSNGGIIFVSLTGKIMYVNKFFAKIHNYTVDELIGENTRIFFNPEKYDNAMKDVQKIIKKGKLINKEIVHLKKDGTSFPLLINGVLIKDENENPRFTAISVIDLTEQKKIEEELQKMEKLKSVGTLAGGIAHDFNNILTGIYGNVSLAQMNLPQNHKSTKFLLEAEKSMERAIQLTKQLLTFSKGGSPIKEDVRLSDLIREVVRFDLTGSNVKPIFNIADNLWNVEADKGQISQVFSNLTINTNQATPEGGNLYISMENIIVEDEEIVGLKAGNYVKIIVQDEGIGIAEKHLNKIFDPYFTTKQTGNGLGLATSYSIIQKHNGSIEIDSVLGKGTTFIIYLPASKLQKVKEEKRIEIVNSIDLNHKTTVLVLDDEKMICTLVTKMLEMIGFSAVTVNDGKDVVVKYQESIDKGMPFDLIIMDLTIPGGMGGKESILQILKIDPKAKVIVSSGYSNDPVMANYADYGFSGRIGKPYNMDNLKKVINEVLNSEHQT